MLNPLNISTPLEYLNKSYYLESYPFISLTSQIFTKSSPILFKLINKILKIVTPPFLTYLQIKKMPLMLLHQEGVW